MRFELAYKDLDPKSGCTYVARHETMADLTEDMGKHAKEVHGYTYEQLQTPEMMEKVKAKAERK